MRITVEREAGEDIERCASAFCVNLAADGVAAERMRDLDVEQMRGVEDLTREQPGFDRLRRGRAKQNFDQRRGVDDDHSRSRSARMTSAGEGETVTGARLCKRARSSSSVGRSAICRISASR